MNLIKDLLSRILPPATVREYMKGDLANVSFDTLMDSSSFDVGTECRILIEGLYDDDTETEMKVSMMYE